MPMPFSEFLIIAFGCSLTILLCRVVPLFVLKGRELSVSMQRALELIPPAAFAALVANDLCKPDLFVQGLANGMLPLIAAAIVVIVAVKTKNLLACAITGVVAYVALLFIMGVTV
jgi:branched-subunit amino acid transport protein